LLDGFNLGLESVGGQFGGRKVEVIQGDDQAKPDVGRQLADKMVESDGAKIITGVVFSNVMLALAKPSIDAGAFVISANAGLSQYAGKQCNPHYFTVSFQNDTPAEVMGAYLASKGVKKMYLVAPNYPAGKDSLAGFKRGFKGEIVGEVYTTFGQLDYAAELAQIRAAKPDGLYFFLPGGMGINFVKQYAQAGLKAEIPLYGPSFSLDQTVLPAMGDAAIGAFASNFWSEEFQNPASVKFVTDFQTKYHRIPSPYAAQSYDTARLLDAALKTIGGKIEDKKAFQKALETVKFDTVRGKFRFNTNHYPIQDYYLTEITKNDKGQMVMSLRGQMATNSVDTFAEQCQMPSE
jgi:branched-chain amino acid transport system substrate-binding protein